MFKRILVSLLLALLTSSVAFAQSGSISGQVIDDATGDALPAANVIIQELTRGTASDVDGNYLIANVPAGQYTLVVSYLGFKEFSQTITVGTGNVSQDISLVEDYARLEELVVTGYGSVNRQKLTASIAKVDASAIEGRALVSTEQALQGQTAGVTVLSSNGAPGGGMSVRVRGQTSIGASSEPLYVVDGIAISSGNFSQLGLGNQGNNVLADINPSDIESIEVLKDAAATSLYGARAANGVVVITTRRGTAGRPKLSISYYRGSSEVDNQIDQLTGSEYVAIRNEGVFNDFGLENWYGDPDTMQTANALDAVLRTAPVSEYRASLNGGGLRTRYFISGTFYDQEGIVINSEFSRLSGRLNLDHALSDVANLSASVSYSRSQNDRLENDNNIFGVLPNALLGDVSEPIYNPDGTLNPNAGAFDNPIEAADAVANTEIVRFLGQIKADYQIMDGLEISLKAGLDRFDMREQQFSPSYTAQGAPNGTAADNAIFNQTWLMEAAAKYAKHFGDHDINALAVFGVESTELERITSTGSNFVVDELRRSNTAANTTGGSFGTLNGLVSYLGSVDYSFRDKYLVGVKARVDGSSRFGAEERYAFFPAVSAGWRVSDEGFMQNVSFINELKIRGSYGLTGNQNGIGNFSSLGLFTASGIGYRGTPGLSTSQVPNPNLKWETTAQASVGLDIAILSERLTATVEIYQKDTDDLLLARPVPSTTGFTTITENVGATQNKGFELSLTGQIIRKRDLNWSATLNVSTYKNEVITLYDSQPINAGFASRIEEGQSLGSFYGYKVLGIFQTQEEADAAPTQNGAQAGDFQFKDVDGDGIITSADQEIIGSATPDWTGGFSTAISYKGFELSAFAQFTVGNEVYNNTRGFSDNVGGFFGNSAAILDHWTEDNTDAKYPRASNANANNNYRDSDFFLEDGSYIRLKTVTLAYNVPATALSNLGVSKMRVYATGLNLITLTDYSGFNPEVSTFDGSNTSFGTDFLVYPASRTVMGGVQLTF